MIADALRLSVYFGDSLMTGRALASDALVDCFARHGVTVATLFRGIEGFGLNRRIHAVRLPDLSADLPLIATAVVTPDRTGALLDDVDRVVSRGLVTIAPTRLATDSDVAGAEFPGGLGGAVKLTVYCGRGDRAGDRPSYQAVVDLLRRHGAAGATVLLGVDGVAGGRRERARLFRRSGNVPLAIVSIGATAELRRSLTELNSIVEAPVATLEAVALLKHDGHHLEPFRTPTAETEDQPWQRIGVITRESAQVEGRSLYTELTRRLREAGAAGVTTIRGEWGFSSDEHPHGDRLGRLGSHVPTSTVCIDRPTKMAELWPIVDRVTEEHGIVTSLLVPGYRERTESVRHGFLPAA